MSDCLVVLAPRNIEECVASFRSVDQDVAWLQGFTEPQLEAAMNELVESTDYDFYVVTSDDTVISQKALDAVLGLLYEGHPVVTGYCPLDAGSHKNLVNLSSKPLPSPVPSVNSYEFMRLIDVQTHRHRGILTHFAGMALTGMHRTGWEHFPMTVSPLGLQTDYSLSYRLQEARIPIVAAREGLIDHVKQVWNSPDTDPRKQLLIGKVPAEVRLEVKTPA